jgi:hypothetical protein
MAGFAVNLKYLLQNPRARQECRADATGFIESDFLQKLGVPMENFEIKANKGTKVGFGVMYIPTNP